MSSLVDQVTSWFNIGAIVILWINIQCLLRDKSLKGYSIYAAIYFFAWAVWGIFMYQRLDLFWSMIASCVLSAAYAAYIVMILFFKFFDGVGRD